LPEPAFLAALVGQVDLSGLAVRIVLPINKGHDQAGKNGEDDRADRPGEPQLPSQDLGGKHDGQDVDRRTRIEEGRGRPDPRPADVDPGEERQNRTGADGKHRPRDRGHRIGEDFVRLGAEVFQHRGLGNEYGDRPGDEKGGDQAGEHMFAGIVLEHQEGLQAGPADQLMVPGEIIGSQKPGRNQQ